MYTQRKKSFKAGLSIFVSMMIVLSAFSVGAKEAPVKKDLSVEEIIKLVDEKGSVFSSSQGTAELVMDITKKGKTKSRTMSLKVKRDDGLLKALMRFEKPAKVSGISFMVLEKKDALPDQYVYVPTAKVVRRVAPGNASSSFFGSDFAYIDLMPLPASSKEQAAYKKLADNQVGKQPVYVLEALISVKGSPYSKLVTYIHQKLLIPIKIEFFDSDGKALKTLNVKKIEKIDGEYMPTVLKMRNLQKKSSTVLSIKKINRSAKISDSDFTEEAMKR